VRDGAGDKEKAAEPEVDGDARTLDESVDEADGEGVA
jgi:hypothetical protein